MEQHIGNLEKDGCSIFMAKLPQYISHTADATASIEPTGEQDLETGCHHA
jgi:hypothetical protein